MSRVEVERARARRARARPAAATGLLIEPAWKSVASVTGCVRLDVRETVSLRPVDLRKSRITATLDAGHAVAPSAAPRSSRPVALDEHRRAQAVLDAQASGDAAERAARGAPPAGPACDARHERGVHAKQARRSTRILPGAFTDSRSTAEISPKVATTGAWSLVPTSREHGARRRPLREPTRSRGRSRGASRCCAARMLRHGAHHVKRPSLSGSSARPTSTRPWPEDRLEELRARPAAGR